MKWTVRGVLVAGLLAAVGIARAETVKQLPPHPGYINDYAGVLSQDTQAAMTDLCRAVNVQAQARIAVVTLKTIEADDGSAISIEEFATALEDKWKVGAKGTDRGVLMILVMNPRRGRIEVGYGLEGILNDAKVGDIGREMSPYAQKNDYDDAVRLGVKDLASVIAADKGVSLDTLPAAPQYHWQQTQQQTTPVSPWKMLVGGGVVLVLLIVLASTGNLGVVFWLLLNLLGGGGGRGGGWGGGGGGGGGGDDSSGFGGGSGGGGASGDF